MNAEEIKDFITAEGADIQSVAYCDTEKFWSASFIAADGKSMYIPFKVCKQPSFNDRMRVVAIRVKELQGKATSPL